MSGIRILGIIIALLILALAAQKYRSRLFKKGELALWLAVSLGLFLVSVAPDLFTAVSKVMTGRFEKVDRVLSILILSNLALYFIVLKLMAKVNASNRELSRLVQAIAVTEFKREYVSNQTGNAEKKILAVIPAYNEQENIGNVLKRMPEKIFDYDVETLVVVDGATDNTEAVVRELGFPVVVNRINRGGGAALRAGYQAALQKKAEIVVTLDADGQHRPEDIAALVAPIMNDEADFTSGSRIMGAHEGGAQIRQLGIFVFNKLISLLLWRRITDCSNAFRALRVSELGKLDLRQDQFHSTELIIDAVAKGIRFEEVPITVLRRASGESKKPKSLRYGWGFTKAIFKTWWRT